MKYTRSSSILFHDTLNACDTSCHLTFSKRHWFYSFIINIYFFIMTLVTLKSEKTLYMKRENSVLENSNFLFCIYRVFLEQVSCHVSWKGGYHE